MGDLTQSALPSWAKGVLARMAGVFSGGVTPITAHRAVPWRRAGQGHIALVGAGPGARDLLTLRAIERINAADVVFYDRLIDEDVRAMIPKTAEQVYVGKVVGAHAWPQEQINDAIVAAGLRGLRVVRLKSGDPSVFGRAGEEVTAAEAAGVPVEIVPGITAASAMAAHMGQSLTERGISDTLVLTTGHARAGAAAPDCTRFCEPGTTTAFYMSVGQSRRIQKRLLDQGVPPEIAIQVGADIAKPSEQHVSTTLANLPRDISEAGVTGCAIILFTWPKMASEGAVETADMSVLA